MISATVHVPRAARLSGTVALPGDKSISHRLALLGGVARGATRIRNFSSAADCASTLGCLQGLGVAVERSGPAVVVHGGGFGGLSEPAGPLDAGNSGSTLRMLSGILAGRPFTTTLVGDASLSGRPVERVAAPLRAMGAIVETTEGHAPVRIIGTALRPLEWRLPVASAQVKSAVLLAGLQAHGRTTVEEPAPSRDHTERLLPHFGAEVERSGTRISVSGPAELHAVDATVPGDPSSAAFLVVAAGLVPGAHVRLQDVLLNPTRTAFLEVLRAMGARVSTEVRDAALALGEPVGAIEAQASRLRGVDVPPELVPSLIDEVPVLAVAAAFAEGTTRITGAGELRVKESDRLAAVSTGLRRLGVDVEELPDGLVIRGGGALRSGRVESRGDHRIAMAFSVAGLALPDGIDVEEADCVAVSFPEFYDVLARLRRP